MTDHWNFYPLRVDDQPASIFVDLGAEACAPVPELPHMAYVSLRMRQPRPDGLSSSEEFDALVGVENALEQSLCSDGVAYVGRNTSSGCRDFYFYVASPVGWAARVEQVMQQFREYEYDVGSREDAEWSVYKDFLLPGPRARQSMENRTVCEALEGHGDTLTTPREIDHWSHFPDQHRADAYLAEVTALGYQLRDRSTNAQYPLPFSIRVWRIDTPSYQAIDGVTMPLYEASARNGGDYDGWECVVVT
jgi:Family of unknown function (DUF695)/Regulator of ribonuclease activity B